MGAESTFTYQNFNVERGLLWAQENAVNRGIQVNQTLGKYLTASLSWNDGYYSNRYSWLSGSLTFTKGANTPRLRRHGQPEPDRLRDPGDSGAEQQLHARRHLHLHQRLVDRFGLLPVQQRPHQCQGRRRQRARPRNGFAAYLSKSFKNGFALPGRFEYITQSGSIGGSDVNLLGFGPGSSAISFPSPPPTRRVASTSEPTLPMCTQ